MRPQIGPDSRHGGTGARGSENRMADMRHIETELETIRQAHYVAGDQVNLAQAC